MNPLSMTEAEREAFLAALHVGVIAIERADGPPLALPIWYSYEPGGDVTVLMNGESLKSRLIGRSHRFTLCVQDETPPYKYVSVEGPAVIEPSDLERDSRPMARRYLGEKGGDRYVAATSHDGNQIRVTMKPTRWFTIDYSKAGR